MTGTQMMVSLGKSCSVIGLALLAVGNREVRADRIVFRGGGQIKGKVLPDPAHPKIISVLTEKGKTPLTFEKPKVLEVIPEASVLDEYLVKREKAAATVEAQFELGLWAEKNKLTGLANFHFEEALRYDKTFGPAHQKLGHVQYASRWLTSDELREAQGLVRYKGKWLTKDEKEAREAQAAVTAEQATWVRRLKRLREALLFGNESRHHDADVKLRAIKDPIAVKPLVVVFGEDEDEVRSLLDSLLGSIDGPEAARALVSRVLVEPEGQVRRGILEQLIRRDEPVVPHLVKALRSENPAVVNRAAWTLGNLGAVSAVPTLIPALHTTQYQVVMGAAEPGPGGAVGMNFGVTVPQGGPGLAPMAYNGSSVAYLTGPVVGPGSVAFGATTAPALPTIPSPFAGAGGGYIGRGPIPKLVPVTFQNIEVLNALNKLTEQDFGYNVDSWKQWVTRSFQPEPVTKVRRVPQP